jgi:hypothetical protein
MIRISQAFDSNTTGRKYGRSWIFRVAAKRRGGCPGGNRPFTMPREWGRKARADELKRRPAPPPAGRLSVRLSGL